MARFKRNGGSGSEANKPVHSLTVPVQGGSLDIAVWENSVGSGEEERTFYNVSFKRTYYDNPTKSWKDTAYLRQSDLLTAAHGLQLAFDWCVANQ